MSLTYQQERQRENHLVNQAIAAVATKAKTLVVAISVFLLSNVGT